MNNIPHWYVLTLGKKGYEQIVISSGNPNDIQAFITFTANQTHFVVAIIQLTPAQRDSIMDELYPNPNPK